ncbi:FAD-dependent monooxygenase [Phyllobacterium sp. 21LDTY02-6]|uniref:FAD-dependent oxidoreductase n=1 Tax=Phyllobacterium sp. 21LDTY02-6 TaxID=2944903 RepID=UPI00202064A2|nr:NAD(P)/FAD-dependent oxidoreductase [Phyllobacterium sp. 21LDTY02-6]MCO4316033.1 FAD-dependent monooxygenase [Phyllobacterium sp. 21LDTY02-6]
MKKLDVAIVGAGPAGLAAALYLNRSDHRITLFERFSSPSPVGSGLILQPTGLTILDDLGLFDAIRALGNRIDRLHGTDAVTGRTVLDVKYSARPGGRFGLAVHRAALFDVLYRAVLDAGIAMETDVDVVSLESGADKTTLLTEAGRRFGPFDLVVDASGARSKLIRHCLAPSSPRPLAYGAYWASLKWHPEGFDNRSLVQRYQRASTMIGVLPIGRTPAGDHEMAAFFWSTKPEGEAALRQGGLQRWKDSVLALWPECSAYLDQISSFDEMTLARYGHHTLARPIGPRLAIIGDAAHSTSPQLGQGANMAMLDARALAHALAISGDLASALSSYARSRRNHIRGFQMFSRVFTPFYQSDSHILPLIRDHVVSNLARIPPVPQQLASLVAGTFIDPFRPIGLREKNWL